MFSAFLPRGLVVSLLVRGRTWLRRRMSFWVKTTSSETLGYDRLAALTKTLSSNNVCLNKAVILAALTANLFRQQKTQELTEYAKYVRK